MTHDKICLEGMIFYGFHGVYPEEKSRGQRFIVDLELITDLSQPGQSDALEDTVNYGEVYSLVREVMEGRSHNLMESLAHLIAARVLERYNVEEVKVTVHKPDSPIKGAVLAAARVEVTRRKDQT